MTPAAFPTASEAPSAGGAAFDEILIAAAIAFGVMAAVGYVVVRERTGHTTLVGRLADRLGELEGLPRWVSLPSHLAILSLVCAGFGVWWDVPIHMQNGRDEGPLANPSHYFIFLGILGFLHAGVLGMALARDPLPRRTLRLTRTWRTPIGPLVLIAAGTIALLGFPADDLWHRLFGQDVTEWGPTHVMMIGGAVTCTFALPLLHAEAQQVGARGMQGVAGRVRGAILLGFCLVPYAFLMEFELGLPQFPAVTQFIIAGFLTGWIMVAARMWFGRGGALIALGAYFFQRAVLYVLVALLPSVMDARFLLFAPAAVLAELVALLLPPARRATAYALVSGVAIGSLGLFGEWLWSGVFMPQPQPFPAQHLPLFLGAGTAASLGGSLVALWMVARLRRVAAPAPDAHPELSGQPLERRHHGLAGVAVFVALMAVFAPQRDGADDLTATVHLVDVTAPDGTPADSCGEGCRATVRVTFDDPDAVEDAVWFTAFGWQGRGPGGKVDAEAEPGSDAGGVLRYEMEPTGEPGTYQSSGTLALHGHWKAMLRLHLAPSTMQAIPLHFPDDPAIESPRGRAIQVLDGDPVVAVHEPGLLQRERKDDVPGWLWSTAYAAVIVSWLLLLLGYGWCYNTAAAAPATSGRAGRSRTPQRT